MKFPKVSQRINTLVLNSAAKARKLPGRTLRAVRKPHVDLGTVATVLQVTGQIGADVPFLQAIMETSAKALKHIEVSDRVASIRCQWVDAEAVYPGCQDTSSRVQGAREARSSCRRRSLQCTPREERA